MFNLIMKMLFLLLLPLGIMAEESTELAKPSYEFKLPIVRFLTDDVRVMFVKRPELPMVDVRMVFDAGAARDGHEKGLAFITNQMIGEGASGLDTEQIYQKLDELAVQFSKASYRDMSIVSLRSLSYDQQFNPAIDLVAELIGKPSFPKNSFERIKQQTLTALNKQLQKPDSISTIALYKQLYSDHPYSNPPMGDKQSITKMNLQAVAGFYKKYFTRKNLVIAIVGDLTEEQAKETVSKLVKHLPLGQAAHALPEPKLAQKKVEKPTHIQFSSEQSHIQLGTVAVPRGDKRHSVLYLGNHILGGSGLNSKLMEEVRIKHGLTYGVWSFFVPMRVSGPFLISLQTRNQQASKALSIVKRTMREFIESGPTPEQLAMAKEQVLGTLYRNLSTNRGILNQISMMGFYGLNDDYLPNFIKEVKLVKLSQIQKHFRELVVPENMKTIIVGQPLGSES